ncbi:MAG: carboxynorspermidine decarboxylase, partial [Cyclobacteriaceae bacterium]|nr:carboxynorspermidine decarboxylase [Cyclobacteriaceae bacterium HetDA_MAG_MS6]
MKFFPDIPSPCFVLEEERLLNNLTLMNRMQEEARIDIILAFKGFAMWSVFPVVREFLKGATASSLNEAKLCVEEMHSAPHTYAVAYKDNEFDEIASLSSYLTFNSVSQFYLFKDRIPNQLSCGLRVNPEWSDVETDLYNPASPTSRLGVTAAQLGGELPPGIEGLHFHVLCESSAEALQTTLMHFEEKFGNLLHAIKWVNMGGGHLITREGYDLELLIQILKAFREKYEVRIILEPGSAVAWQAGFLKTTVIDIVENAGVKTVIIDASFTCHMPDCLEMPYRPVIRGA